MFIGMQKLKEFSTSISLLKEMLNSLSAKRMVIPDETPDLHRGEKNSRNANYMVNT